MRPRTVAQYVRVLWTKASRGSPEAKRRNAVPQAFELPDDVIASSAPAQVHAVAAYEWNGFAHVRGPDIWAGDGSQIVRIGCANIEIAPSNVRLRFEYNESHGGAPGRYRHDAAGTLIALEEDVCQLSPGEWARVTWNGRFVNPDTGEWWYELHTLNVAFVSEPTPAFFLSEAPIRIYSQHADLA